ncbi:MAG: sensor histidine kinase [Alphaproteobacteria bacterium]
MLAVAAVQSHLQSRGPNEKIDVRPYLAQLCASLAGSMIGSRSIEIKPDIDDSMAKSGDAVSIGLIVTELVINALKHGFPVEKAGCRIGVRYESNESGWRLTVADNGVGKSPKAAGEKTGLGTSIVAALADQLSARTEMASSDAGLSVSVTSEGFQSSTIVLERVGHSTASSPGSGFCGKVPRACA